MPFFPMRPTHGASLRTVEAAAEIKAARTTHVVHRKLNGDRVLLAKAGGAVYVANRHGRWYTYGVENRHLFAQVPDGSVFDGEVHRKLFCPFDMLAFSGDNLTDVPVESRVDLTQKVCASLGVPWRWEVEDRWLDQLAANAPTWEGVVLKLRGSPYSILGSDGQESASWSKRKWSL
jgi:ATP-dependent DNA ligase